MGIHGLPPVSGPPPSPLGPGDQQLLSRYQELKQEFLAIWGAYETDPSQVNENKLVDFLRDKLLPFLQGNEQQIKQLCSQNGWAMSGSMGYNTNVDGMINNLQSLLSDFNPLQLGMLNETLTTVWGMLSERA